MRRRGCDKNLICKLGAVALMSIAPSAFSMEPPTAGTELRQIPPSPALQKPAPELAIENRATTPADSGSATTIVVSRLHLVNALAFPDAQLIAASGFIPHSELSLSALRALAAKIADYYHGHGYFLAQALLPAQDINDGVVTISIIEGQYGKVVVRNRSSLSDDRAQRVLAGLNSGDVVTIAPLESRLLQLSDLPGVNVKSTLVPGASVGATDLIVDLSPGQRLSGSVDFDNAGSRYTGPNRAGATLNLNNPLGRGDVATLRVLTSFEGLNYGRAAYQQQYGKVDAGIAYTALDYELGRDFESLEAHGTAQIASAYGRYAMVRSRRSNLYAQIDLDAKTFADKLDVNVPRTQTDKTAKVAMLSVVGDRRDAFAGGGLTLFSLTWTTGSLDLQSPQASSADKATAQTNGHFDKFGFTVTRLQNVTDTVSVYAALQSQIAAKNLDVSEKLGLGGASAVRAYPEGEAYVDQGYVLNLEARMSLRALSDSLPGDLQATGFLDTATGRLNRNAWDTARNNRTLSGAGLGLNWLQSGGYVVKASYAHQLGNAASTSTPGKEGRFWISASKRY
jgi:hemolysin activation/secretion protein